MSMQTSQRVPFRPNQCPQCAHFEAETMRCRAYATPSWPQPLLAVLKGASLAPCPQFEQGAETERAPSPQAEPAPQLDGSPHSAENTPMPAEPDPMPGTGAGSTKACPACGAQIEADSRFCRKCGARFGVRVEGYCQRCRAVREANAEGACSVCGGELFDRRAESRSAPAVPPAAESKPAAPVRQGEPRIYCRKCKAENPPTVERCGQCGADLLPAESAGTRIVYLVASILAAALLGFLAYRLSTSTAAWEGPSFCNPVVLFVASLATLIGGIALALRRTPRYVRYSERAQRHVKLNPWQALADLGRAIELAPKKERAGLLKRRLALYEQLGLQEAATRDLLAHASDPDAFKGEAALVGALIGADSDTYARSRSAGALKALVDSGRASAVGYCPRCKAAVQLDARLRCSIHPRTKGSYVQYVLPGEVEAGKRAALSAWEKQRRGCRTRVLVAIVLVALAMVACILLSEGETLLEKLPWAGGPEPTATVRVVGGYATFAEDVFAFEYPADWSRLGSKEIRSLKSGSLEGIGQYGTDYMGGVYTGGVNDCLGCAEITAIVLAEEVLTGSLPVEVYERIREAEERQMGSRLLLHRLTSVGSLPAVESQFLGKSLESQQWQLIIVPTEPGKAYLFSCSSHRDSWDEFEAVCARAMESLTIEGAGETGVAPAAAVTAPAAQQTPEPMREPTQAPTPQPTAASVNGCPPDPAMVHIVNELGADLAIELSFGQTYHLSIPSGQARDVCLPAGDYAYTISAQGFNPETGTRQLVAGVHKCWWWFKGEGGERECDAPTDHSAYWPP